MMDWNKCGRSLEWSPVRKMMAWKGETGSAEILPLIALGPRFTLKDPNDYSAEWNYQISKVSFLIRNTYN